KMSGVPTPRRTRAPIYALVAVRQLSVKVRVGLRRHLQARRARARRARSVCTRAREITSSLARGCRATLERRERVLRVPASSRRGTREVSRERVEVRVADLRLAEMRHRRDAGADVELHLLDGE